MSDRVYMEKYELANKWLCLQIKESSLFRSLKRKGVKKIIIYGASDFALRLMELCKCEGDMELIAISDKAIISSGQKYKGIPLIPVSDIRPLQSADTCIVITTVGYQEEIEDDFKRRGIEDYILLRDLIYDAFCEEK